MAKRHHHMEHHSMPKSSHHAMHPHTDADYSDYDKRRMRERMDANMIHEDHSAPANLPQNVMLKYWPEDRAYMPEVLDDTIRGIDSQIDGDDHQRKKGFAPHKF